MQYSLDFGLELPQTNQQPQTGHWRVVRIEVDPLHAFDMLEDLDAAGVYQAEVSADFADDLAAACALGAFHTAVVVNWPEGFLFRVFDKETDQPLKPNSEADWARLGMSCINFECMGTKD